MILKLGDPDREVPVFETFHKQTDEELTEKDIKQMEADDQAIQTILRSLPEDIYDAVDSCEIAQKIQLRVQQMMKGSAIEAQEKKAKLFNEWEMFTSTDGNQFNLTIIVSKRQFCDSDLKVAFRKNSYFVRNLEGVDLLKGDRSTNLYTINLHEMASVTPICLMARASSTKSWLWHQRLSHLNFDTINGLAKNDLISGLPKFKYHKEHLCLSCEQGKSKRASHPPNPVPNSRQRLHLLYMDLCGRMRIASINEKCSKPGLQSMTSGQITMYDDFIGGQPSAAQRTVSAVQAQQVRQTSSTSTSIADSAPTPKNSSSHATNFPNTSQDVDELNSQQQHVQQQGNQAHLQSKTVADNVQMLCSIAIQQTVIRNKSRLVVKVYRQEEGFDFEESFAPISQWRYNLTPAESKFKTPHARSSR
nr:retrovirus-related Pol polyprotein from transposon TNT 1-94 [Tanacetum cinerariifolium]